MKYPIHKIVLIFHMILLVTGVMFAQTDREQGIKLYNQGDFNGVITILKNSKEVNDLYYLGLSYEKVGETDKAKDAFKKSFVESYNFFFEKFNEWQKTEPPGSVTPFSELLQETKGNNAIGFSAAEKAFSLKSEIFQTNEWRIKAKVLFDTSNLAKANEKIYPSSDKSISDAKITERTLIPSPKDLSGAPLVRRNQSPNKPILVKVFIICGTDGKFKLLMPMDEIIDVYTAQVISGIEKYKFQIANKDGKPVAYYTRIQYSFSTR